MRGVFCGILLRRRPSIEDRNIVTSLYHLDDLRTTVAVRRLNSLSISRVAVQVQSNAAEMLEDDAGVALWGEARGARIEDALTFEGRLQVVAGGGGVRPIEL